MLIASATGGVAASLYSVLGASFSGNDFTTEVSGVGKGIGLFATGNNTGTTIKSSVIDKNVVGVYLTAASNIVFGTNGTPADGNTMSNSSYAGLQASGACTNSFVYDTTWTSNAQNVISTATGLTISPAAP